MEYIVGRTQLSLPFLSGALLMTAGTLFLGDAYKIIEPTVQGGEYIDEVHTLLGMHPFIVATVTICSVLALAVILYLLPPVKAKFHYSISILFSLVAFGSYFLILSQFGNDVLPDRGSHIVQKRDISCIQEQRFGEYGVFLKGADRLTLYSLEPEALRGDEKALITQNFHGYRILGSLELGSEHVHSVWSDLQSRVYSERGNSVTSCFWPRHGLRVHNGGELKDYVICFYCHHLYIYSNTESDDFERIGLEGERINVLLNKLLDEAGVEREKSPEE